MRSGRLRRIAQLPPSSWAVMVETVAAACVVELLLGALPLHRLLRLLRWLAAAPLPRGCTDRDVDEAVRLCGAVVRRLPWRLTCLKRSLTVLVVLSRRGLRADLKLGLAKAPGGVRVHAWLEHNGRIIMEAPEESLRFPAVLSPVPS